jgi:Resolvase, N terminal domain
MDREGHPHNGSAIAWEWRPRFFIDTKKFTGKAGLWPDSDHWKISMLSVMWPADRIIDQAGNVRLHELTSSGSAAAFLALRRRGRAFGRRSFTTSRRRASELTSRQLFAATWRYDVAPPRESPQQQPEPPYTANCHEKRSGEGADLLALRIYSQRYEDKALDGKRVGLYLRVSTDDQTVESQREALVEAVKHRNWRIVEKFVDNGTSGVKGRATSGRASIGF